MDFSDRIRDLAPDDRPSESEVSAARAVLLAQIAQENGSSRSADHAPRRGRHRRRLSRAVGVAVAVVAVAGISLGTWAIARNADVGRITAPVATSTSTPPPSAALRQTFRCAVVNVPAEVLADPVYADTLDADVLAALDAGGASITADAGSWIVVDDTPDRISLIRNDVAGEWGAPGEHYKEYVLDRDAGGAWRFATYNWCRLQVDLGVRVGVASIALDPSHSAAPDSTALHLLVMEQGCAGGDSAQGRVELVSLEETGDEVRLIVGVRVETGMATCPGNPWTPYTVELDRPLGDRSVWNYVYEDPVRVVDVEEGLRIG
ncbi:hypothetical protein QL996_09030 [Planococcus sp. APC 4015]|nr:hypothetical protein [Planococcus sp. APC 4015]